MANQTSVAAADQYGAVRRVSWGAIFAGTVVALVVQIALTLLGLSIGLGVMGQAPTTDTLGGVGIGAGIWLILSTLASLFIGGFVAARLAGIPTKSDGVLNGIVVWALATLLSLYLATSTVGSAVSGVSSLLGQGFQLATRGVTAVAPQAAQTARNRPQQAEQAVDRAVNEAQQQYRQARRQAERALSDARQEVQQTTRQAAPIASGAALAAFVALLLGAIAAALGGMAGRPKDVVSSTAARP